MDSLQDVMEIDRVRVAGVRAPQDDQVGVLDFLVGTSPSPGSECCRQTGDARSVSSAVAAVDVIASDYAPNKLLRRKVQLICRLRATEHAEGLRSAAVDCALKRIGSQV